MTWRQKRSWLHLFVIELDTTHVCGTPHLPAIVRFGLSVFILRLTRILSRSFNSPRRTWSSKRTVATPLRAIKMSAFEDDEFDSGDDLFDGVTAEELVQKPSFKHKRDYSIGAEALNPTKKPRFAPENAEDQSRLRLAEKILAENFGHKSFRHEQKAAINRILAGKNALVVFPTGAGKSLCYQVSIAHASSEFPPCLPLLTPH